jgi:SAM-dependent methyltransferase
MSPWFEDDTFWRDYAPVIFGKSRLDLAEPEVTQLLALTGHRGGPVLDLCCGPGRHAVALARRRIPVTGVDRTELYLSQAREAAEREGVQVELVLDDMRTFVREGAFDLAICMFNSLGYCDSYEEDLGVLRNMRRSLRPGGKCLIEAVGREIFAMKFRRIGAAVELPDGTLSVQSVRIHADWTRLTNRWTLVKEASVRRFEFHHNLYSGSALRGAMLEAGFAEVDLFGSLEGIPYDDLAMQLVALGYA